MTELSNAVIDAIVCAETGFAPEEATQAMTHEELRRIVKACIVKRVRLLAGFDAGTEAERRLAAPEAAEPVAQHWWCSNCAAPTAHSMRGHDLCCDGCHLITATRHDDPDGVGQAGRDAVEVLPGSLQALQVEALEVFDGPETPQDVRDVIEWYSSSIAALIERARSRIDAALSTTTGRAAE